MSKIKRCCEQDILCEVCRIGHSLVAHAYRGGLGLKQVYDSAMHSYHFLFLERGA